MCWKLKTCCPAFVCRSRTCSPEPGEFSCICVVAGAEGCGIRRFGWPSGGGFEFNRLPRAGAVPSFRGSNPVDPLICKRTAGDAGQGCRMTLPLTVRLD